MAPSQFLKRKLKSQEKDALVPENQPDQVESQPAAEQEGPEPVYQQTALDIYTPDGGKTYEVAEISYNPTTKEAKVTATFSISRLVALTAANQKTALNTLKRKLIKKD